MYEIGFDKTKDIVNIHNATKQFKIFDSDNNLIIEGNGASIFDFLRYGRIIVEYKSDNQFFNVDNYRTLGDCDVRDHWEENGVLYYKIILPFKFLRVDIESNTIHLKKEIIKSELEEKITPLDKRFNIRKTAALTSLFVFLCMGSFLTGNILLHYTNVNIILPWLLLFICIATFPFMLYYILKLEKWMNEK